MTTITWSGARATIDRFINVAKFPWEIQRSTIVVCMKSLDTLGNVTYCEFKAELSEGEKVVFAALVEAHDSSLLEEQQTTMTTTIENENFAEYDLSYKMRAFLFTIPNSAGPHFFDISFPYPIMLLGGVVETTAAMLGDSMQFDTVAMVTVGQLTSACVETDTHIEVNEAAAALIYKAYKLYAVTIDQSGAILTSNLLGEVISKFGTQLNLAEALDEEQEYSAGTYIAMEFTSVEKIKLQTTNTLWISRDTERGACVPANTKMLLHYWNTVGGEKEVQIVLDFYI
jgi:hypothetical protein